MRRGEKLQYYIKKKGYNTYQLAKESGVAYTTIRSMIENDLKNSSVDNVIKLSRALGIQVEDLIGENKFNQNKSEVSEYPYFPISVSAGLPVEIGSITNEETIVVPDEVLGKHARSTRIYFLRVNGESMNKIFPHNSLIAVKQIEFYELRNGDIVVYSDGNEYAVKRFYDFGDKLVFKPESNDPHFVDYIVNKEDADNLQLHGKVVAYIVNLD